MSEAFTTLIRCPASPTDFLEVRDGVLFTKLHPSAVEAMTRAEILASPDVRPISHELREKAWLTWLEARGLPAPSPAG